MYGRTVGRGGHGAGNQSRPGPAVGPRKGGQEARRPGGLKDRTLRGGHEDRMSGGQENRPCNHMEVNLNPMYCYCC